MTGPRIRGSASREVAARHLLLAVDLGDFAWGRLVFRPSAGCWCHTVVGNPITNPVEGNQNSIAPGMDRWSRLWMGLEEVMKDVQQNQYMFLVTTELRLANIMNNDVTDFFGAVL